MGKVDVLVLGVILVGEGAAGVVEAGLVPTLVEKLKTELEDIAELILDTLHFCLRIDTIQALNAGAVSVLKEKLSHTSVCIRWKAARAMMGISVPLEGKKKICEEEVIPLLVRLLSDQEPKVQANAAGALMSATITTQGRYAALEAYAIPPLLDLIKSPVSEVRLNVLKTITTLAEAPAGRKELLNHLTQLSELTVDTSEAVQKAAKTAVRVISWKP
ncbi:radial spoke head 14 homolog [Protopterus annectens]|uniref:radial spoke head 14 homolog n=1 Tax=Protopterus annectens TaxID=7888 RepID=UPI001CFB3407|nr:radial spoke head 14 homolog [Protopterus annectens]